MRYKKKKRQIVSAALAAMMAMQLCIPSAAFAAVPTKQLKVITGFTELPEEVAHIQIPADAGENFEDYLNFPETIEASVVEYKNVDHQNNNADRDKGAEDEKAAADDSDKKEDSEIATDSNAGDFLEDYEFEDEEIPEDIPVLTDISVTWEPDENREDESGFYYYLPVLPREYILAEGVELPEIEVSMDGGIALLASTDTYNIANGGININSNTLEQYKDATITGSSTTNVILVNGVEATITISNLDIQIPLVKNDETASTWVPAIRLVNNAKLNLILEGTNTLKGGDMCAAIEVPEGCTLTISGEGSLKATGGEGAGIGASSRRNGSLGTIVIDGGDIKAYGGEMAAGIGGSAEGGSGTIIINNGTVYAKGGHGSYYKDIQNVYGGAGIGGGANGCVDRIEINGGNVTAYGGYATNAGRHPGAAIGTGGGGAKAVEGGYKYGDIAIKGGTVLAIAYQNEVYAIGIAVKPGQSLPGGTLDGSISISNEATVNLNGGDYFPKSENPGLKNYTIQGTIADVRFIESTYPVTISVGGITWNAGTMKVSDYQVTLKASNYLKPLTPGTPVTVTVTVGDYVYRMEADVADVDDKNATITLKAATPLYETRLKFVSTAITSDQVLQAADITIKQDGEPLINQEGQSAAMVIPSMQISYDEANTGHLTVYLPENKNKTEISVTVPGLNDGNPITKSGETISTITPNEIAMFYGDTVCSHEHYNADGFCEACGAYQEPKNWQGYYEIYNAGQLFWFAKQFNDGKISNQSNLKLMKDIEIPDGHDWTSIRDKSNTWSFEGTIEGNYHVISGLRPAKDDTNKWGLVAKIKHGSVQNIGLVFEGDWTCGLCRTATYDVKIQNCFVVGTDFLYSSIDGVSTKGTVTNCLAVSGKLEGTKTPNDRRTTFTNCYETTKGDFSSLGGITTISEEKLKSGEIAYKLNGDRSDGTWGQVIGTEDYPHFRKYSKTVYYDPATKTYSNNNAASITSAAVTDIKTISDTKATATLKATGTPGAEVKFFLTSGEDAQTGTLDDMFSKGTLLKESPSGNYECTIENLTPDTEYHVRLMIKKDGKLSLDVTYVNFQTEKVRQEAPKAADVSINYEQETLENKASCDLEYAASKDAQSWTTIRQGGKVRLTGLLNNIRENGGSVPVYIRKKASSSMSASEAVLAADLQTQAIPGESNKPNIDYRKEKITISSSLQYVIVNGTNTSPNWTSAKMGSESGISITDIISSDHESTVYYRYAASDKDKKFAGKPESITILKRTAAPAAITENEVKITGTTITINRTNPENDIEYGYRDADSDGAFTWIDGTKIQGLYPAHGYQVTSRIKAKENAFASERTQPLHVSTKDTLRIVGNGTPKWDAKGTYGVSLAQIPVSLASGYGVYNGANQLVAGTWSWEPENSSPASGIYPKVEDNKAYTVKFTPTDASASYDRTLTDSVVPEISKYPLNFSVAVKDKTYDGTTNADITSVTFDNVTLNRGTDYTVTASFDDAGVGNGKNVTATVTLTEQTAKNYALEQSSFPTTGSITKAAAPDFTKETALTIVNGHEKTYTVTLPALPTLETPKAYGALTYEIGEIKLNDGYYTSGAKVENGELTLPIQKNDVETTGSVGTVTVVIKSINYKDITLTVKVSAVNQIKPVPDGTITATPITYGNELSASTITGTMQDPVTGVAVNGTFTWDTPAVKLNAGSHNAKWTFTPDKSYGGKYTTNTGTATVTVNPKAVTVSGITANDKVYDGTTNAGLDYSAVTLGGVLENDTLTVTATGTMESADVGEKKVTISNLTLGGDSAANYVLAESGNQTETTATITAKEVTATITPNGGTYGSVTAAAAELSGAVDGENVPVTLTYTGNGYNDTAVPVNAGSYTVTASIANSNYTLTGNTTADFVITPKAVTVSGITANDKVYDGTTNAVLDYSNAQFDGILENDKLTVAAKGMFEKAEAGKQNVAISDLKLGGDSAANYVLAESGNQTETTATITAKEVTVTPDNKSKVYEEKDPKLTYIVSGVLSGETLKGITLARAEGENAGEYDITATADAGANPNYEVTFAEGKFTINPKSIDGATVKLGKALTANGAEQTQTVEKVLLNDKELPADSYTVAGNTATDPGSHTLTITAKGNYTGAVEQTYVIVPAKAEDAPDKEITIGNGKVKVDIKFEGTVPPATLLTDKAELLAMLVDSGDITADELAQIADGAIMDIVLTVKEANVPDAVKTAMAQAAKDYTIGQYLDISLFKYMTVNGNRQPGAALHTTKNALPISVVVPDALIHTDSAVNRNYCIVRCHEGAIAVLDAAFDAANKTLTFKTDRFSVYAIAYKDTAVPSSGSNPGSNNSSNDSETKKNEVAAPTPAPTPASTSKPSTITAMPQTGDTSNPTLYVVLLVASLLGLAVVFVCKKRNDK